MNGKRLGFRYFDSNDHKVTLYLNWPVEKGDLVEITVLSTQQTIRFQGE